MPRTTTISAVFPTLLSVRAGIISAILLCLICGSGCNHTPSPEKRELSEQFYNNLLIAFSARDYALVKTGLQKIEEAGIEDKRTLYLKALVALIEKRSDDAITALKTALVFDPEYGEAHNALGCIYMQQKRFTEAETEFFIACNNPGYQTPEKAYLNLGKLYQLQDKNEQAQGFYIKATAINSDYFPPHYELCLLYINLNKFEMAAQEVEKARQISPKHPGIWYQIGEIEKSRQNDSAAIEAFKKVLKLQPQGDFADRATKQLNLLTKTGTQ
ncbi:MAG: tetratricopeptide repeat protein [Deltaproteobacteria bacterium]|nr:tetratricopeptide repeat protein [Candidatus Tharpella sp.]